MDAGLARPSAHAQDGPEASGTAAADGNARVPEVPPACWRARRALVRHALGEGGGDVQRARHRVHAVPQAVLPARARNHTYTHDAWVFPKTRDDDEARRGSRGSGRRARDEETPRAAERSSHAIPTTEVVRARAQNNRWIGPPRAYLRKKFDVWSADHLCRAQDVATGVKSLEYIEIGKRSGTRTRSCSPTPRGRSRRRRSRRGRRYGRRRGVARWSRTRSRDDGRAADRKRDKANGERSTKLQEQAKSREPYRRAPRG